MPSWLLILLAALSLLWTPSVTNAAEPIHALLIIGGCCHDYTAQKKILSEGISARANVTWTILHEVKKVWPTCTPLAESLTPNKPYDKHTSIWVNTYGKARIFGTTLGHGNETVQRELYLDLLTRGLLWACDKLGADGKPKPGYE